MLKRYTIGLVALLSVWQAGASLAQENSDALYQMDQGAELMNQGQFAKADGYFMRVLKSVEVVPADLCFYFGKNSYHLDKYKQSIDWLNKYIELKGTKGRFFDQATEYLALAKSDYSQRPTAPATTAQKKSPARPKTLDCEQHPFVTCPVCNGDGVVIEAGKLGSLVYRDCPYSDDSGRMTCEDYHRYLRGDLNKGEAGR